MKKLLLLFIAFLSVVVAMATGVTPEAVTEVAKESFFMEFLSSNIEAIGIIITWLVVRLVPTSWKDPILMVINWLISIIPDKKIGGGTH